jgi:hypothetical protein
MNRLAAFALAVAAVAAVGSPASAATYNAGFGPAQGVFNAPLGGGLISAFSVTLGNTVFDLLGLGAAAPVYNPILNQTTGLFDIEFRGFGQPTGNVFNSVASAQCPVSQCVLQLFDTTNGVNAPDFLAFNIVTFQNVAFGTYMIDPTPAAVPLPAAGFLLGAALAGAGLVSRRRRTRRA